MDSPPYSLQRFVDERDIRGTHRLVLLICSLLMAFDAFDVFVVGKIAPAIAAGLGVAPAALTTVFVVQQAGLAVGAFVATPLADRFGRQRMMALSSAAFGFITLASTLAHSLWQLAILRGIAGLFMSGLLPMAIALIAETVPGRRRGTYVSIAFVAYTAGAAAGGLVAVWLLDRYGWRSAFVIGGALPLLLLPAVALWLPESLLYLAATGAAPERIRAGMRRLDPQGSPPRDVSFVAGDVAQDRPTANVALLFEGGHRRTTLLLWAATFLSMGSIALLAAWLPTFFQEMAGVPIKRFAVYALIGFWGGLAGSLSSGWLLDRLSATRVAPVYYLGLAAILASLGWMPREASWLIVAQLLLNFFQSGGQAILNIFIAQLYPTAVRSTGIGWAGGMGRIGGIVLPPLGGLALASHWSLGVTMTLVAAIPIGVIVALAALGPAAMRHKGRG